MSDLERAGLISLDWASFNLVLGSLSGDSPGIVFDGQLLPLVVDPLDPPMDEIRKVKRAAGKAREGAPDEIWLVVDATTGQNALRQAQEFNNALGLTGVILTKLDGTAKGGVILGICNELGLPVRFIGLGEPELFNELHVRIGTGFNV